MCQEIVKLKSIGYSQEVEKCKLPDKFKVRWKQSSGILEKTFCTKHKNRKLKFIETCPYEQLISVHEL